MSKASILPITPIGRVYRVYLDRQGYDDCGRYYGTGLPVYGCWYSDRAYVVRAVCLTDARRRLRLKVGAYAAGESILRVRGT